MSTYKVATTDQFEHFNSIALEREYNRALTDEFMASLDPEGIHVCYFTMPHEHRHGEPCAPHLRTMWYCKVAGKDEPVSVQLDCDMDLYHALDVRSPVA